MTDLKHEDRHFEFYVAGVQFHDISTCENEFSEGSILSMIPEPTNKYDPNAIALRFHSQVLGGSVMIGYVPKKINVEVHSFLTLGSYPVCKVLEYNPDAPPWNKVKAVICEREEVENG